MNKEDQNAEAAAFDEQIIQRIKHGHKADLRFAPACDWFYNNVWRRPYLVRMLYGPVLNFCLERLGKPGKRVLEVGCGPGFMSLELARNGHDVVGIDVSSEAIQEARLVAVADPLKQERGKLQYFCADLLEWEAGSLSPFDAIVFFGSLHHFSAPKCVMQRAQDLLCRRACT